MKYNKTRDSYKLELSNVKYYDSARIHAINLLISYSKNKLTTTQYYVHQTYKNDKLVESDSYIENSMYYIHISDDEINTMLSKRKSYLREELNNVTFRDAYILHSYHIAYINLNENVLYVNFNLDDKYFVLSENDRIYIYYNDNNIASVYEIIYYTDQEYSYFFNFYDKVYRIDDYLANLRELFDYTQNYFSHNRADLDELYLVKYRDYIALVSLNDRNDILDEYYYDIYKSNKHYDNFEIKKLKLHDKREYTINSFGDFANYLLDYYDINYLKNVYEYCRNIKRCIASDALIRDDEYITITYSTSDNSLIVSIFK